MLARLFVIAGVLIVLALTAALVGPRFVDWTAYRAEFEARAAEVLARPVSVRGEASVRLLPFPSVTFTDVAVGGPEPTITVESFSMDAELAPLLSGELRIFDMRLTRPRMVVDLAAGEPFGAPLLPSAGIDPRDVALERVRVTDGELVVRVAGGDEHVLSGIDAELSARSLAGPWRAEGDFVIDGHAARLSVSTGVVDESGAIRLRIRAEPQEYPLAVETEGMLRLEAGAPSYAGEFRAARRAPQPDAGAPKPLPSQSDPGIRLSGKFAATGQQLAIDNFRLETGPLDDPYIAEGTAALEFAGEPRFSIEAHGAQVQLAAPEEDPSRTELRLAERFGQVASALARIPKPSIPGSISLDLPAVVAGGTTVREVRLAAEPAPEGWRIASLSATLPGRTTLEADGLLVPGATPRFSGSLLLAVAQPSGFAAWLARDVEEAARALPAGGFSASVELGPDRQSFKDLELVLGDTSLHGRVERRAGTGARPALDVELSGDALDLTRLETVAALFLGEGGVDRFAAQDVNLRLTAEPVSVGGFVAGRLDAALRLNRGTLEVDRLALEDLSGASVTATGRVEGVGATPNATLNASVVGSDLSALVDTASARFPENRTLAALAARAQTYPGLFGDARVELAATAATAAGGAATLDLSAQGSLGGSGFSANLKASGRADTPADADVVLSFEATNEEAAALLALYGAPVAPLGLTGAGRTTLTLAGVPNRGLKTALYIAAGDNGAAFEGVTSLGPDGFAAKGAARLDAADVEPWLATAGVLLPGMGLGTQAELAAEADLGGGLLVLSNIDGTIAQTAVSGDLNLSSEAGKPHVAGALALDALDLDAALAAVLGEAATAAEPGRWPTAPFPAAAGVPFSAELDLAVGALSAAQSQSVYDADFQLAVGDDGLSVSGFTGKLFGGTLSGLFELRNNGGTGLFSAQTRLADADLALALTDSGITGRADLSAELSASGKSVRGLVSALTGSGSAALRSLRLPGINAGALPALLAAADAAGNGIDAAATAKFAAPIAGEGIFAAERANLSFSVAAGVVKAPSLTLANEAAGISADLELDLNVGSVAAAGTIAYAAGDEALAGAEPAIAFQLQGPLGAADLTFDTAPLAQFLTQRALEREQARVEAMQAALLERQRLRREARYYSALQEERQRAAESAARAEAAERVRLGAERNRAVEERRLLEEEAARNAASEAARLNAAEAVRAAIEARERGETEPAPLPPPTPAAPARRAPAQRQTAPPPVGERATEELKTKPLLPLLFENFGG